VLPKCLHDQKFKHIDWWRDFQFVSGKGHIWNDGSKCNTSNFSNYSFHVCVSIYIYICSLYKSIIISLSGFMCKCLVKVLMYKNNWEGARVKKYKMNLGRCLNNFDVNQLNVFFFWVSDEGIVKMMMEKNKGEKRWRSIK